MHARSLANWVCVALCACVLTYSHTCMQEQTCIHTYSSTAWWPGGYDCSLLNQGSAIHIPRQNKQLHALCGTSWWYSLHFMMFSSRKDLWDTVGPGQHLVSSPDPPHHALGTRLASTWVELHSWTPVNISIHDSKYCMWSRVYTEEVEHIYPLDFLNTRRRWQLFMY